MQGGRGRGGEDEVGGAVRRYRNLVHVDVLAVHLQLDGPVKLGSSDDDGGFNRNVHLRGGALPERRRYFGGGWRGRGIEEVTHAIVGRSAGF